MDVLNGQDRDADRYVFGSWDLLSQNKHVTNAVIPDADVNGYFPWLSAEEFERPEQIATIHLTQQRQWSNLD